MTSPINVIPSKSRLGGTTEEPLLNRALAICADLAPV
jgi:hypothetical protein